MRDGLFIDVTCSAILEDLAEGKLVGWERGSFTGALARHAGLPEMAYGALLLDEACSLPAGTGPSALAELVPGVARGAGSVYRSATAGYEPSNFHFFGSLLSEQKGSTGLLYMRNRFYDPQTGRFTQEDPIGIAGGLNLYGFANGDPINFSDPFGLCPECEEGDNGVRSPEGFWKRFFFGFEACGADNNADCRPTPTLGVVPSYIGGPAGGAGQAAGAFKAVNLPSWRRVAIDMGEVASGHMAGGNRVSAIKTLFPEGMSSQQVERVIRQAYRSGERLRAQGDRVLVKGTAGGLTIEMWVNRATKTIETAYPVFR